MIDEVSSAEAALASLDEVAYDVVLTDSAHAARADGHRADQAARASATSTCRSSCSPATPPSRRAVDAMREGAFDYLRKTASGDELRTAVQRALGHGRMAREVRRLRGEVARGARPRRSAGRQARRGCAR